MVGYEMLAQSQRDLTSEQVCMLTDGHQSRISKQCINITL